VGTLGVEACKIASALVALSSRPRSNSGRIGAGANCKCLAVRRGYGCLVRKALKREGLRVHKEKVTDVLFKRVKVPKYEA